MLFQSQYYLTVVLGLLVVILVQCEHANSLSTHHSKNKIPTLLDEEATQWLSPRNARRRWHHRPTQQSNEVDQTLKQLQSLNDNGIRQFDTQAFEGVSMEVIFEMVYKQQNNAASSG